MGGGYAGLVVVRTAAVGTQAALEGYALGGCKTKECVEPGSSDSRIITPALAQLLVLLTLFTRAIIEPAPLSILYAKWNSSALSQMSSPEPVIVNVPTGASVKLPTDAGLPLNQIDKAPTSCRVQLRRELTLSTASEFEHRLGVRYAGSVCVHQRHGLGASVDNCPLSVRR